MPEPVEDHLRNGPKNAPRPLRYAMDVPSTVSECWETDPDEETVERSYVCQWKNDVLVARCEEWARGLSIVQAPSQGLKHSTEMCVLDDTMATVKIR